MDEKTARELIRTRKAVRQKYNALKSDVSEQQIRMEKEFKPITQPLQELIKTIKTEPFIKQEMGSPKIFSTPKQTFQFSTPKTKPRKSNVYDKYLPRNLPTFIEDDDVFLNYEDLPQSRINSDDSGTPEPTMQELIEQVENLTKGPGYEQYLEAYDPLVRTYVDASIKDREDQFDHRYGLIHDIEGEKFKIANSLVDFDGKNVIVEGRTYEGTPGLYELLFKKEPIGYKPKDLDNYMDILEKTNAYRRNSNSENQIQGTTHIKYLTIIKPYLMRKGLLKSGSTSQALQFRPIIPSTSQVVPKPPQRPRSTRTSAKSVTGQGAMLNLSRKKLDYVYYDDINEIIERLKLLISSQIAGHTGHQNEIISILEELREAKIIE